MRDRLRKKSLSIHKAKSSTRLDALYATIRALGAAPFRAAMRERAALYSEYASRYFSPDPVL
jgi:hypothetical protein